MPFPRWCRTGSTLFLFIMIALIGGDALGACTASPSRLCLSNGRFQVDVAWQDFSGGTGVGKAIPLTADTGYFWFFNDTNVELIVKVLDARVLNGKFWVFYGALSNVAYTMTVTDTETGRVKTYTNPSGTFGSVGDTEAFSAEPDRTPQTAHRISVAPAADTLCPASATSLHLSTCRFRVEVKWKDFQGGTGIGTPVSLTSDTGYFWFFSPNNVELVVKVLDGRALNNQFWVFYGALSNVEYELTVTDTVTGNVNTYTNPSGRFASVGHTEAFRSGYGVRANLDEARAVSQPVLTAGGTISATAADGTTFALSIPAGALLSDEEITLTPIASIDGLPLSGGATAVHIRPEGLRLHQPATLLIQSPRPIATEGKTSTAFGFHRTGDEFHLYPATLEQNRATLQLMHFSGYGAGSGTDAEIASQRQRQPASAEDHAMQQLEANARFDVLAAWFQGSLAPRLAGSPNPEAFTAAYFEFLHWQQQVITEPRAAPLIIQGWEMVRQGIRTHLFLAQQACLTSPARIRDIVALIAFSRSRPELMNDSGILNAASAAVPKCLRFGLVMDSRMKNFGFPPHYESVIHSDLTFNLELSPLGDRLLVKRGFGLTDYVSFTAQYPGCSYTTSTTDGNFFMEEDPISVFDFHLNFSHIPHGVAFLNDPSSIQLAINHGFPLDRTPTITCGTTADLPGGPTFFITAWTLFHSGQLGGGENETNGIGFWLIKDWEFLGGKLYARKIYSRDANLAPGAGYSENTELQLLHRPQL